MSGQETTFSSADGRPQNASATADAGAELRAVPTIYDGGDIDDDGRWYGEPMCCLECRETDAMRMGLSRTYLLATLECSNCLQVFAEVWI